MTNPYQPPTPDAHDAEDRRQSASIEQFFLRPYGCLLVITLVAFQALMAFFVVRWLLALD